MTPRILRAAATVALLAGAFTASHKAAGSPAVHPSPVHPSPVHPATVRPATGASPAELAASAEARSSGRRVEVVAKRTESGETYAEPDGTFTAVLHAGQVRARTADGWQPVDTRLRRGPDGRVVPGATVTPLTFSGGGDTTLVRLASGGRTAELTWPAPLPAPVLSGDTATYPEVLPGVDLRLTAAPAGFHEVLLVKTRQAARDPRVARLRFGLRTRGLSPRAGRDGGSLLVSSSGETVFSSPAPRMWDAGSRAAAGVFESARDSITVVPDRHLLSAPETRYPVAVDPDWLAPAAGWAKIFSGKPGRSYWNGGDDVDPDGANVAKVGYCDWPYCNGVGTAMSFFQFDIRGLHGALVVGRAGVTTGAEFNTTNVYSPACDGTGHNYGLVLLPADFNGAYGATWTTPPWIGWNQPIGGVRWEMHGYGPGCPATSMGWGVGDWVRYANDNGATYATFALAANDPNHPDKYTWKKFRDYTLLVHYDWPPKAPSSLSSSTGTNSLACSGVQYVNNATGDLTLRGTASDPDGGQSMWQNFEWWTRDHATRIGVSQQGPQGNPSVFTARIPHGTLADRTELSWRAITGDGIVDGPWSPWCDLTVDNAPPAAVPELTPVDPPAVVEAGRPLTFKAAAGKDGDVGAFWYGLSRGGGCVTTSSVSASSLGGSATFSVVPLTPSQRWDLWVTSVDRAGNHGPCLDYPFQVVAGSAAVADWPLDGAAGTDQAPDLMGRHDGTATGATRWIDGRAGDGLSFDGRSGYVSTAGGTTVDTSRSFSVSAWARLDSLDTGMHTVVSEDGSDVSGFFLDYRGDTRKWTFWMPHGDCGTCGGDFAAGPARAGVWTHLVGVYDAVAGRISLYVDGVLAQTTARPASWPATGSVQIGRAEFNGVAGDYMLGGVDEVQIYDRVLSDLPYAAPGESVARSEIDRLAAPPLELASYPMDEGSGAVAGDDSGSYRTMALTGATWTEGRIGTAVHLDGTGQGTAAGGPIVTTDQSFTVMALARIDDPAGSRWQVVFGQDGTTASGFLVEYRPDTHTWSAAMAAADSANPGWQSVDSRTTAQSTWQHLSVVHDAGAAELRLYVNGALEGTRTVTVPSGVSGPFRVGSGLQNGRCCGFAGSVDDVHLYAGVVSDQEIRDAGARYTPRAPSPYSTSLERFVSHDGHHYVGTGPVPPWYTFEGPMGMPAPAGAPGTQMLYSCRYSGGYFVDLTPDCAGNGHEVLGEAGAVYTQPPADVPTVAIYRCVVLAGGDHFVSRDESCESTPDKIRNEGRLGYVRNMAPLLRFAVPGGGEWTSAWGYSLPAGGRPAAGLGYLSLVRTTGTVTLNMCRDGADQFLSLSATCDGGTLMRSAGEIWSAPPSGATGTAPLLACRGPGGDRFESLDQFCEGGSRLSILGYVVTQF